MSHLNLFRLLDKIPSLQEIPRVDEWVERHHQELRGQIQVVEAKWREHRCSVLCVCVFFFNFSVCLGKSTWKTYCVTLHPLG